MSKTHEFLRTKLSSRKRRSLRDFVSRRDRAICSLCGLDCIDLENLIKIVKDTRELEAKYGLIPSRVEQFLKGNGRLWDMDHIIPLAEGGPHTAENIRTLCIRCHTEVTRQSNKGWYEQED